MYYLISLALILSSCNYAINLIHTEGSATDMVDDTQDANPNVSPKLNIPFTNGPSAPRNYVKDYPKNLTGPIGSTS
jgi:hypothetical protein